MIYSPILAIKIKNITIKNRSNTEAVFFVLSWKSVNKTTIYDL